MKHQIDFDFDFSSKSYESISDSSESIGLVEMSCCPNNALATKSGDESHATCHP